MVLIVVSVTKLKGRLNLLKANLDFIQKLEKDAQNLIHSIHCSVNNNLKKEKALKVIKKFYTKFYNDCNNQSVKQAKADLKYDIREYHLKIKSILPNFSFDNNDLLRKIINIAKETKIGWDA